MIIGSEDLSSESPSVITSAGAPRSVIPDGSVKYFGTKLVSKLIDVRAIVQAMASPFFSQKLPGFEDVQQAMWNEYNAMATEGLIQRGEPRGGCKGCRSSKIMKRYRNVYRLFVKRVRELAKSDPRNLDALRSYFDTAHVIVQDPDTGTLYRF